MNDVNIWIGTARLTRDPEVRYMPNGTAACEMGLASNYSWRPEGSDTAREETLFLQVVAFGKRGENCGKYLRKGSRVLVTARLKYETWEKDGQKRSTVKGVASDVQFLDSKRDEGGGSQSSPRDEPQASPDEKGGPDLENDDIPF